MRSYQRRSLIGTAAGRRSSASSSSVIAAMHLSTKTRKGVDALAPDRCRSVGIWTTSCGNAMPFSSNHASIRARTSVFSRPYHRCWRCLGNADVGLAPRPQLSTTDAYRSSADSSAAKSLCQASSSGPVNVGSRSASGSFSSSPGGTRIAASSFQRNTSETCIPITASHRSLRSRHRRASSSRGSAPMRRREGRRRQPLG